MTASPLFCDTCGAANRQQALFCFACGRPLSNVARSTLANSLTRTGMLASSQTQGSIQRRLLHQRYRVLELIGTGGFGAVYKVADIQFGERLLAVKEMSSSSLGPQELAEAINAFKREAMLLAGLNHPHLPRIYEQFHEAGRWYLVMDFIEGVTLEDHLSKVGGKLPVDKTLAIGIQLCSVLEYLHSRQPPIIFRDLKPANIMLTGNEHIYLIDFGIARHFKPGQSKDTTALGSSGYAAPEQYGKTQSTQRTDLYSLSATLHQMLSGDDPSDTPFHFAPLQLGKQPALSKLEPLLRQMLEIDMSKRPANAAEVKQALQLIANQYTAALTNPLPPTLPPGYRPNTGSAANAGNAPNAAAAGGKPGKAAQAKGPQSQKNTLFICKGHSSRVTAVAWSPDGSCVASSSYDKTIRIWNAANGKTLVTYRGHSGRVNALAWSPDSRHIVSVSDDQTVQVWDVVTGKYIFYGRHKAAVNSVCWSPDGTCIASAGADKTALVWEVASGQRVFSYHGHSQPILALTWSPDGRHLASGGEDRAIHIWEPVKVTNTGFFASLFSAGRGTPIYGRHTQKVQALCWSPDSRYIASAGSDKTLQVWDANNTRARPIFTYHTPGSGLNTVAWSPNGRYIAAGGNDKSIQVWERATWNVLGTYLGHSGYVISAVWSPDSTRIASGGVDRTIQIWRVI
jgi:serine/threonine protein kinase